MTRNEIEQLFLSLELLLPLGHPWNGFQCARCGMHSFSQTAQDRISQGKTWHDNSCPVYQAEKKLSG